MSHRGFLSFFVALVLLPLLVSPVAAEGLVYGGGGLQWASFAGDLKRGYLVDIHPAPGVAVNVGFRLTSFLALEVTAVSGHHDEYLSSSGVTYDRLEAGPRLDLPIRPLGLHPFLFGGMGRYRLDFDSLEMEGDGWFGGAGIEETAGRHSMKLTAQSSFWETDPGELEAKVFNVGLYYNYHLL